MTAFGKLLRTTAFKIMAVYLAVFLAFAATLVAYLGWHTQVLLFSQVQETLDAEIAALSDIYSRGGIRRLAAVVDWRSRQPGSNIYLLTTFQGETLAGNIAELPGSHLSAEGWADIRYRRMEEADGRELRAMARAFVLPGGFRLVIGRDLEEREKVHAVLARPMRWALAVVLILGITGGAFVTTRVLRRVDAIGASAKAIMDGNLSERLPVAGTGDEFDRLGSSLNAMLERIEGLMRGLKEVSDNIAHDLKTPLTRLRNRAEEALRTARTEDDWRAALEDTIAEADGLIGTFNALLMIARAEAGRVDGEMTDLDAAEVVQTVGELYEPVAEEKAVTLIVDAPEPVPLSGSRELIGQALANLVDNALKYGLPQDGEAGEREITIAVRNDGDVVVLTVADRGPGIDADDRERAVERFVRLESSRSRPGSGLGLSLAAAVARLHGGILALADNSPGLKVVILLPRGATQAA
ncbi:sensor histidine kinase [Blastochloris sulfoviridis]|uniref:histidine kinase n=1 Tax=Blastochloris sulfoviridis TaxID=50712 RepID=A0A5M6HVF1_9HYPH|nr:ATP-binding protein [Blastochloris sulfoviridis]KAA5599852.1 HAMP domain-containing protein [Blastochloris sulfoviridis]